MWARGGTKERVDRQLLEARAALPPSLREPFDRLLAGRSLLQPDPAPYFGVLGHPLFELPLWTAARLARAGTPPDEARLDAALGVSALGYLHARAYDDWLDGDAPGGVVPVALAGALLARCTGVLARVVRPSARFWRRYEDVMGAAAAALQRTDELRRAGTEVTRGAFEELLAQSRPLVIPSLALLDRADRWDLAAALERFVFAATASAQLFNDLTDAYRDRDRGQPTWVTASLDGAGGPGRASLPGEALRATVREALAYHDRAGAAARDLGLDEAAPWLTSRRALLEGVPAAVEERLVEAFAGRLAGMPAADHRDASAAREGAGGGEDPTGEEAAPWRATERA